MKPRKDSRNHLRKGLTQKGEDLLQDKQIILMCSTEFSGQQHKHQQDLNPELLWPLEFKDDINHGSVKRRLYWRGISFPDQNVPFCPLIRVFMVLASVLAQWYSYGIWLQKWGWIRLFNTPHTLQTHTTNLKKLYPHTRNFKGVLSVASKTPRYGTGTLSPLTLPSYTIVLANLPILN